MPYLLDRPFHIIGGGYATPAEQIKMLEVSWELYKDLHIMLM